MNSNLPDFFKKYFDKFKMIQKVTDEIIFY